jgi:hypothetical protein
MATKRNAEREQEALQKLFEQRSYIGGRLPEILDPTPPDAPKELPSIVPTWEPVIPPEDGERPKRKARSEKVTGLHVILHSIQRDGFPHPVEQGSFLMLPKVFKALLALEPVAVIQVVYEIFEQTIGWTDSRSDHGRREWARLSMRHFELSCGMTSAQVKRGLKRALQNGYIIRRPRLDSFEYRIRWSENQAQNEQAL